MNVKGAIIIGAIKRANAVCLLRAWPAIVQRVAKDTLMSQAGEGGLFCVMCQAKQERPSCQVNIQAFKNSSDRRLEFN